MRLSCSILQGLKSSGLGVSSSFFAPFNDFLHGVSSNRVSFIFSVSAQNCFSRNSSMVGSTCSLMKLVIDHMKNRRDTHCHSTALLNFSEFDHHSKLYSIKSTAGPGLNCSIRTISRISADVVLIPFDGALLPNCSLSTRTSTVWVWLSASVLSARMRSTFFAKSP